LPEPAASAILAGAGLRYAEAGRLATVTLCRPHKRNAQDPAMWSALRTIGMTLGTSVRVVVVRAEGPSFSAGIDRSLLAGDAGPGRPLVLDLAGLDDVALDAQIAEYQEAFSWLRRPDLVTIAAVQGHAVGAGFQLALACDLRVLADDARLAMRETSLGLVPDLGGTGPLVDAVGYSRALEICVTGRWVDAEEARRLGLATIVVPRAELDDAVADLAAAVSAPPAGAVSATKGLLQAAACSTPTSQLNAERKAQAGRLRELAGRPGGDGGAGNAGGAGNDGIAGNKAGADGVAPPDE
jgi:enoyl-CoA hydratase/carnithine racemase